MSKTPTRQPVDISGMKPLIFAVIVAVCLIVGVAILSRPKAATNWQIMNAGDSIMQAGQDNNIRTYLYDKLKAGGVTFNFIGKQKSFFNGSTEETQLNPPPPDNGYAGRGGLCLLANARAGCGFNGVEPISNDNGILGMIQESWQAGYEPNVYVTMGGVNDRGCGCDVSARYKQFLQALFDHTPDGYVFFATGYVAGDNYYSGMKPKLEALAVEFQSAGKKAYFVDAGKNLNDSHYTSDNVHPNEVGHELMAEEFYKVMIEHLGGGGPTPTPTTNPTPTASPTPTISPTPTLDPSPSPSPTLEPTPTVSPTPTGDLSKYDIDNSGTIGVGDLSRLIQDYPRQTGPVVSNSPADFNNSGRVDINDLSTLLRYWGQSV